jgi:hypothetical protein
MLGALLPLILNLAPQLAGMIFGPRGGEAAADAASLVRTVTGADPSTPEGAAAAASAIQADAKAALTLQQKLAALHLRMQEAEDRERENARQVALEELKSRLTDTASARAQTIALATSHGVLAYGSMILSGVILLGFSVMLYVVLNPKNLEAAQSPIANVLLGTLAAMATQVANYWLGSSSGSAVKSSALVGAQTALAHSVPAEFARSERQQ